MIHFIAFEHDFGYRACETHLCDSDVWHAALITCICSEKSPRLRYTFYIFLIQILLQILMIKKIWFFKISKNFWYFSVQFKKPWYLFTYLSIFSSLIFTIVGLLKLFNISFLYFISNTQSHLSVLFFLLLLFFSWSILTYFFPYVFPFSSLFLSNRKTLNLHGLQKNSLEEGKSFVGFFCMTHHILKATFYLNDSTSITQNINIIRVGSNWSLTN